MTAMRVTLPVCLLVLSMSACKNEDSGASSTPASTAKKTARSTPEPSIVFLGDSLTAGYGLSKKESMPALIGAKLQASGVTVGVINAGRSGDTTAGGLARLDWYLGDKVKPVAFVVGLGSNDAMRGLGSGGGGGSIGGLLPRR